MVDERSLIDLDDVSRFVVGVFLLLLAEDVPSRLMLCAFVPLVDERPPIVPDDVLAVVGVFLLLLAEDVPSRVMLCAFVPLADERPPIMPDDVLAVVGVFRLLLTEDVPSRFIFVSLVLGEHIILFWVPEGRSRLAGVCAIAGKLRSKLPQIAPTKPILFLSCPFC